MTSITLMLSGAKARASVSGPLTSGMVGIPVTIEYDDTWKGLTKNLVCRCGKWGHEEGETRAVLNVGKTATVAHEVMKADMYLYLGIEGYSADGKLVIPTTWAPCGIIQYGANADEDPSANPKLSIWRQLQLDIRKIEQSSMTDAQITALVEAYFNNHFTEMPDASQNASSGISTEARKLLITILRNGVYSADQSANITALAAELGVVESDSGETEVTLSSISATYSGGDVAAGTAVSDLTGIVVTAHYSDGTSETVTGYTLSGVIAEGENTITVSYGGKITTFAVTGVSEAGGDSNGTLLYNWDFTKSLTDTVAGNVATLNGAGATQDSNGLSLVQSDTTATYASFATNIHGANRRYEIDVSSIINTNEYNNIYFLHCAGLAGFFGVASAWKFYSSVSWEFIETGFTGADVFDEKTVSVVINEDYSWDLYVSGELVAQSGEAISKSSSKLTIGSTATNTAASMNLCITGLRVYDLGGA